MSNAAYPDAYPRTVVMSLQGLFRPFTTAAGSGVGMASYARPTTPSGLGLNDGHQLPRRQGLHHRRTCPGPAWASSATPGSARPSGWPTGRAARSSPTAPAPPRAPRRQRQVPERRLRHPRPGRLGRRPDGIPNYQATLNVRFNYDTAVKVQNAELRIYDRTDPEQAGQRRDHQGRRNHPPRHHPGQHRLGRHHLAHSGRLRLHRLPRPSPGVSGLFAGNGNNGQWTDTQHDWYVAISASPTPSAARPCTACKGDDGRRVHLYLNLHSCRLSGAVRPPSSWGRRAARSS
jgi:hypothetical protein